MKGQFEFLAVGWTTEIIQAFLAPALHSFPSRLVPGDGLVLDVASTRYYGKHSATSIIDGRSVALVTLNSSDRSRKRETGATSTSRCNEACMRKITV